MSLVRCAGCGRVCGVSDDVRPLRSKVYCTPLCRAQPAISAQEFRDDLIFTLSRSTPVKELAGKLDLRPSAAYNIISRYKVLDAESPLG